MSNENAAALPPKIEKCFQSGPDGFLCSLDHRHSGDHKAFGFSMGVRRLCKQWPNQSDVVFPGQSPELDDLLLKAQDLAEAMRKHNLTHLGQLQLR